MKPDPIKPDSGFPDVKQVTAALVRAAQRARQIAEQTGTSLIVSTPSAPPSESVAGKQPASKGG